ncbi:MAG: polysaccharide biosynthesis C-terminal domain-containing protein [Bacteroidetes bacterium]|nr:polysaccharide biosynthesis C-terminal domain-containing protein [Bacteroidota bacterium]
MFVQNEQYYDSIPFLTVLCLAAVFKGLYSMFINPLFYFKQTQVLPKVLSVTAIIQVVSGIVMIHFFGLWGAVWSYFLVRPIQVLLLWLEARKIYSFNFNIYKIILVPILYMAAVLVLQLSNVVSSTQFSIIQLIIAVVLILAVYRNELRQLPMLLKKGKQDDVVV